MELASLYHLLCLTAALLGLALILYAWRYRGERDVNAFIGLMGCAGIWAALSPLIYLSPDAETAHLIYDLQFASTAFVPVFFFLFTLRYTRRDGWLSRGWIALMLVIPILTQVVIWGARDCGLFHMTLSFARQGAFMVVNELEHGLWFAVFSGYSYALMFIGMSLLLATALRASGVYRRQLLLIFVAILFPLGIDLLETIEALSTFGVSLTPIAFVIAGAVLGWNLFRYQFLDLVPMARATLFDSINDGMLALDLSGRILDVNPAMRQILGQPAGDLTGRQINDFLKPWASLVATYQGRSAVEDEITLDFGARHRHYELRISPLTDRDGQDTGRLVVLHDITERKQAEDALRVYAAELEASNAELDAFAHTVAHDLKSPLATLLGFVELLDGDVDLPPEEIAGIREQILRQGEKMSSIVDELLLLASVRRAGDVTLKRLNMLWITTEALQRLEEPILLHSAEIRTPEQWPAARGYAPWVEAVWVNYISNAIKYGGCPPYVELGAMPQENGLVRFWVRDNGAGLSENEKARLFTEFTRLHAHRGDGHGLGLSIVRRIVEKLGGEVGIENHPDGGSIFFFTLPVGH